MLRAQGSIEAAVKIDHPFSLTRDDRARLLRAGRAATDRRAALGRRSSRASCSSRSSRAEPDWAALERAAAEFLRRRALAPARAADESRSPSFPPAAARGGFPARTWRELGGQHARAPSARRPRSRRAASTAVALSTRRRRDPRPRQRGSGRGRARPAGRARNRRPRGRSTSSSTRSPSSSGRRAASTPSRSSRRPRRSPPPRIVAGAASCSRRRGAASVVSVVAARGGSPPAEAEAARCGGPARVPYLAEDALDALPLVAASSGCGTARSTLSRRDVLDAGRLLDETDVRGVRDAGRALVRHRYAPRPRLRSVPARGAPPGRASRIRRRTRRSGSATGRRRSGSGAAARRRPRGPRAHSSSGSAGSGTGAAARTPDGRRAASRSGRSTGSSQRLVRGGDELESGQGEQRAERGRREREDVLVARHVVEVAVLAEQSRGSGPRPRSRPPGPQRRRQLGELARVGEMLERVLERRRARTTSRRDLVEQLVLAARDRGSRTAPGSIPTVSQPRRRARPASRRSRNRSRARGGRAAPEARRSRRAARSPARCSTALPLERSRPSALARPRSGRPSLRPPSRSRRRARPVARRRRREDEPAALAAEERER